MKERHREPLVLLKKTTQSHTSNTCVAGPSPRRGPCQAQLNHTCLYALWPLIFPLPRAHPPSKILPWDPLLPIQKLGLFLGFYSIIVLIHYLKKKKKHHTKLFNVNGLLTN